MQCKHDTLAYYMTLYVYKIDNFLFGNHYFIFKNWLRLVKDRARGLMVRIYSSLYSENVRYDDCDNEYIVN